MDGAIDSIFGVVRFTVVMLVLAGVNVIWVGLAFNLLFGVGAFTVVLGG